MVDWLTRNTLISHHLTSHYTTSSHRLYPQYPHLVSRDSLLGRYPYLLPCSVCSILAAVAFVCLYVWLPETAGHAYRRRVAEETAADAADEDVTKSELGLGQRRNGRERQVGGACEVGGGRRSREGQRRPRGQSDDCQPGSLRHGLVHHFEARRLGVGEGRADAGGCRHAEVRGEDGCGWIRGVCLNR